MEINYSFVPTHESAAQKYRSDVISYAGKLLEIVGARTVLVFLDNDDRPVVFESNGRLTDAFDVELEP